MPDTDQEKTGGGGVTKKPTITKKEDVVKPAIPVAETIPEVVKDVKVAAQEYLDARASEGPTDPTNPDAAKIEEVSQSLDQLAEEIINTPEDEMVEKLEDTEGVEALTIGMIEDNQINAAPGPGRALAITGGVIFATSLIVTAASLRQLKTTIDAKSFAELRQFTWNGYSDRIVKRAQTDLSRIVMDTTTHIPDMPVRPELEKPKEARQIFEESGLKNVSMIKGEGLIPWEEYKQRAVDAVYGSDKGNAESWIFASAEGDAKFGQPGAEAAAREKIAASLEQGNFSWTLGNGQSEKSVKAKQLYTQLEEAIRATEEYSRQVGEEDQRIRRLTEARNEALREHEQKNAGNESKKTALGQRVEDFNPPKKAKSTRKSTTSFTQRLTNAKKWLVAAPGKAPASVKTGWEAAKKAPPKSKLRFTALGGFAGMFVGMGMVTLGAQKMTLAESTDANFPAIDFANRLADNEIDLRSIQVAQQMAAFR